MMIFVEAQVSFRKIHLKMAPAEIRSFGMDFYVLVTCGIANTMPDVILWMKCSDFALLGNPLLRTDAQLNDTIDLS